MVIHKVFFYKIDHTLYDCTCVLLSLKERLLLTALSLNVDIIKDSSQSLHTNKGTHKCVVYSN